MISHSEILSASKVAQIASRYGFDADERIVRENTEQARQYHGKPCGRSENGRGGLFHADLLLDSYLAQESLHRTLRCGCGCRTLRMPPTAPTGTIDA